MTLEFKDAKLDSQNRTPFAFASCNASPGSTDVAPIPVANVARAPGASREAVCAGRSVTALARLPP